MVFDDVLLSFFSKLNATVQIRAREKLTHIWLFVLIAYDLLHIVFSLIISPNITFALIPP